MNPSSTPRPAQVPALLAETRVGLGLSLAAFAGLLSDNGGTTISRQRLSGWESGRAVTGPMLRIVAEVCASLDTLDGALRDRWRDLLRDPGDIEPVPSLDPARRHAGLLTLARHVDRNPRWARYRQLAADGAMDLDANLEETRRRLALAPPADRSWTMDPADAVTIVAPRSTLGAAVKQGELFLLTVTLTNTGRVPWRDRLLVRLGPPVTSSLAFTPPVLSLPDTPPGGDCTVAIPGRSPWFPNLTVITYAMTFPDCRPAVAGSLQLHIDANEERGWTSHPLPETVERRLRGDGPAPIGG